MDSIVSEQTEERITSQIMNNVMKVGQFLMALIALLGAIIGVYVSMQVSDAKLDMRVSTLEVQQKDTKGDVKAIMDKLDEIKQQNSDLRVLLEKKQDRPNK